MTDIGGVYDEKLYTGVQPMSSNDTYQLMMMIGVTFSQTTSGSAIHIVTLSQLPLSLLHLYLKDLLLCFI